MAGYLQQADLIPASLDGAADRLQAAIDSYTRGLLRGAEARASAISDHAARSAERAAARTTTAHATRMLDAIDLAEKRMIEGFAALKAEAEALLRELDGSARRAPGATELPADRLTGTRSRHAGIKLLR
jgi:hypothetical protein